MLEDYVADIEVRLNLISHFPKGEIPMSVPCDSCQMDLPKVGESKPAKTSFSIKSCQLDDLSFILGSCIIPRSH